MEEHLVNCMRVTIPMPKPIIIKDNSLYTSAKIKYYTEQDTVCSVCTEIQKLNNSGYTHIVNMPGPISEILYYANKMHLVVVDHRLAKYVADLSADIANVSPLRRD